MKKQEDLLVSEFRIVKCKKCDAALTEVQGEKLTSCVQCGHNFFAASKNSKRRMIASNTSKSLKSTPEVESLVRKLRGLKENITSENTANKSTSKTTRAKRAKKSTTPLASKKKSNPIGTIIVWIIVFNIVRSIFFN